MAAGRKQSAHQERRNLAFIVMAARNGGWRMAGGGLRKAADGNRRIISAAVCSTMARLAA